MKGQPRSERYFRIAFVTMVLLSVGFAGWMAQMSLADAPISE